MFLAVSQLDASHGQRPSTRRLLRGRSLISFTDLCDHYLAKEATDRSLWLWPAVVNAPRRRSCNTVAGNPTATAAFLFPFTINEDVYSMIQ